MRRNLLPLVTGLGLLVALLRPALAEPLQRMLVAPGCYELAPGKSADISAYCLDQGRRAPPHGALLTEAPASLGDAIARRGAETIPLKVAITDGLLQIEGLGEFSQLRLRNVSGETIAVCFGQPTVVMGVDGSVGSLEGAYDGIKELIARRSREAATAPDAKLHGETQRELWDLVNRAEERSSPRTPRQGSAPAESGDAPSTRPSPRRECIGEPGSTVICAEP
jgi:hypothetical protein